jgi:hypothetical protein
VAGGVVGAVAIWRVAGDVGAVGPIGLVGPAGPIGPKGDVGPIGLQGVQGVAGPTGMTGPTGSVSGLSSRRIDFLSGPYSFCNGLGTSASVVSGVSVGYAGSLSVSKTTLQGCTLTVYTP